MSDFYNKYPYTDFHELNLDWVIERVKKLTEDWLATHEEWVGVQQDWADTEQAWIDFKEYVENYLANLDVQDEIDHKIDEMVANGSLRTLIQPDVLAQTISTTTEWLADHITQPTTPVVDTSLTIAGAAADAKITGERYYDLKSMNMLNEEQIYKSNMFETHLPAMEFTARVLNMSYNGTEFRAIANSNFRINTFSFDVDTVIKLTFTRTNTYNTPAAIGYVSSINDIVDNAVPDYILIHDLPDVGTHVFLITVPAGETLFIPVIYGYCNTSAEIMYVKSKEDLISLETLLPVAPIWDWLDFSDRVVSMYFNGTQFFTAGLNQFRINMYQFAVDTVISIVTECTNVSNAGSIGFVSSAGDVVAGNTYEEILYNNMTATGTRVVTINVPANAILCVGVDVNNCDSKIYKGDYKRISDIETALDNTVYDIRNLLFYSKHIKDKYYDNGQEYAHTGYDYFIIPVENGVTYNSLGGARFLCKKQGSSLIPQTLSPVTYTADFTGYLYLTLSKSNVAKWIFTTSNDADILPYNALRLAYSSSDDRFRSLNILNIGDSIAENRVGSESYSHQFATATGAVIKADYALSGSTLSRTSDQGATGCIYTQAEDSITNFPAPDAFDIIMIDGVANDFSLNRTVGSVVGTAGQYILSDYTATFDETTVLGALEGIFQMLRNAYYGSMIVFVIPHKHERTGSTWEDMLNGIRLACDKWSIPVLDMDRKGELNTRIVGMRTDYTDAGGTHPTTLGIKKYYLPMLIGLLSDHII